jgi:hypothetical protein
MPRWTGGGCSARGAGFIDPACLIVRLVLAGHTPAQAEAVVAPVPAWRTAPARAIDVFASALARMWTQIAGNDPSPWKQQMADAALAWAAHRPRLSDNRRAGATAAASGVRR